MPTSPFALSRRSFGTSRVTSVGSAMLRTLPAMTPNMTDRMNNHKATLATSVKRRSGTSMHAARRRRIEREGYRAGAQHHRFLAMMVDEAAEPDAERRGEHEIDAGDHPGREHRPRLEEYPEGHREPDREIGDVRDQVVCQELMERSHSLRTRASRIAPPTNSTMMDSMPARVLPVRSAVIPTIAGPSTAANLPIML